LAVPLLYQCVVVLIPLLRRCCCFPRDQPASRSLATGVCARLEAGRVDAPVSPLARCLYLIDTAVVRLLFLLLVVLRDGVQPRGRRAGRRAGDLGRHARERAPHVREFLQLGVMARRSVSASEIIHCHIDTVVRTSRMSWAISSSASSDTKELSCSCALLLALAELLRCSMAGGVKALAGLRRRWQPVAEWEMPQQHGNI
jgi:hypothetical protein